MIKTGYVYLDIGHPVVAWCAYRGQLIPSSNASMPLGAVSSRKLSIVKYYGDKDVPVELDLESVRTKKFPELPSRLDGLFYFPDKASAVAAKSWGGHFTDENLTKIGIVDNSPTVCFDSNWYTYALEHSGLNWQESYWNKISMLTKNPIWESITNSTIYVLETKLRKKAYETVKEFAPKSLCLLEISRIAVSLNSNLGNISTFGTTNNKRFEIKYYMDMVDTKDEIFLQRLGDFLNSGEPVNWDDITRFTKDGYFGNSMDLNPFTHSIALSGASPETT